MSKTHKSVLIWMYTNDNGTFPKARICESLASRGFDVFHDFDMRKCHVVCGQVYSACGHCLSDYNFLFHMNADEQSIFQSDILRALEASGVKVINPCRPFFECRDKFLANQKLRHHGVRVPESALFGKHPDSTVLRRIFNRWGTVLYKPRSAHGASGIVSFNELEQFIDFTQATTDSFEHYYLEQYISFGDQDYRVEVFNGQCLGGYSRKKRHGYKTNVSSGGQMMPRVLGGEVEVALAAARVMGIDGTIVDMVRSLDDGEFYVLEVNPLLGIFVESAMQAGTKMPETAPHPAYCYDTLKIQSIVDYIDELAKADADLVRISAA